jgi:hypothetical protein
MLVKSIVVCITPLLATLRIAITALKGAQSGVYATIDSFPIDFHNSLAGPMPPTQGFWVGRFLKLMKCIVPTVH